MLKKAEELQVTTQFFLLLWKIARKISVITTNNSDPRFTNKHT